MKGNRIIAVLLILAAGGLMARPARGADPGELAQRRQMESFAPRLRFALSPPLLMNLQDDELSEYYDRGLGIFAEFDYLRLRNRFGNGIDLYGRLTYRYFWIRDSIVERNSDLVYTENRLHLLSLDAGVRAVYGLPLLGLLWQGYLLAAPRLLYYYAFSCEGRSGAGDRETHLGSLGIVGGAGLEVTLTESASVFAEYNYGYTPVGSPRRNTDGHQAWFGASWRTFVQRH
ncbi:MAG: hypothetical protein JXA20_17840 [Spirochaetes bacterium]|nr:hypothetical protein [Spirochaetota bacterium]